MPTLRLQMTLLKMSDKYTRICSASINKQMVDAGINIAALIIVTLFSVFSIQTIGGFLVYIMNKGFKIRSFEIKGCCTSLTIPPLVRYKQLGMLLFGIISRNAINEVVGQLNYEWSITVRQVALTVILLRAGLGLDVKKLRENSTALLRLTILPQLFEASAAAVTAHFIFGLPWPLSFALGFMMGAVSPAVVVPSCIRLRNLGFGIEKGIPTIVIAASSLDDVVAISLFGIFLGIGAGSSGGHIDMIDHATGNTVLIGIIEIIGGILVGLIVGICMWSLQRCHHRVKAATAFIVSLSFVFVSREFGLSGLGFLGTITSASAAATKWGKEEAEETEDDIGIIWKFIQVPLFGLVGASIYIPDLDPQTVGLGIIVLTVGLCFRFPAAFSSMYGSGLTFKEKLFVGIAWMPKATVQAALGGVLLGQGEEDDDDDLIEYGEWFLTIAVLCIIITAPLGAILTATFGPKLLQKSYPPEVQLDDNVISHTTRPVLLLKEVNPDMIPLLMQRVRNEWQRSISAIDMRDVQDAIDENDRQNGSAMVYMGRDRSTSAPPAFSNKQVVPLESKGLTQPDDDNGNKETNRNNNQGFQ